MVHLEDEESAYAVEDVQSSMTMMLRRLTGIADERCYGPSLGMLGNDKRVGMPHPKADF